LKWLPFPFLLFFAMVDIGFLHHRKEVTMPCTVMPRSFPDTRGLDLDAIKRKWGSANRDLESCIHEHFPQIREFSLRRLGIVVEIPEDLQEEVGKKCGCTVIPNFDFEEYSSQQVAELHEVEDEKENNGEGKEKDAEA